MILSEHSIKLNPTEAQFVALLDDFAGRQDPPVECRIAGGWVRDKVGQRSIGSHAHLPPPLRATPSRVAVSANACSQSFR
jgi:hypothetical protein